MRIERSRVLAARDLPCARVKRSQDFANDEEVGAPAAAVRGEHRAHAAQLVDVGADDDPLVLA